MSDINNRGVAHPPVSGTPTPAQASSVVHTIDTDVYASEFYPKGYHRCAGVDENVKPLSDQPSTDKE